MQTFEKALLQCDIDVLINEKKPRSNNNKLYEGFKRLKKEKTSIRVQSKSTFTTFTLLVSKMTSKNAFTHWQQPYGILRTIGFPL